jgi:hypothetical protein
MTLTEPDGLAGLRQRARAARAAGDSAVAKRTAREAGERPAWRAADGEPAPGVASGYLAALGDRS